jgi:GH15 family glucan-1,4-alpha-glucosidase
VQPPLRDYALVGDTRTAALVSGEGSIDWMCLPRFDGDPVFGRLLDDSDGGLFSIRALGSPSTTHRYLEGSCLLERTSRTATGVIQVTEGMVTRLTGRLLPHALMVRSVRCIAGTIDVEVLYRPKAGLPGRDPRNHRRAGALISDWGRGSAALTVLPDLQLVPNKLSVYRLREGEEMTFALAFSDRAPNLVVGPLRARELLHETDRWWREWISRFNLTQHGGHKEAVVRSLITIRLLTHSPSGAPVAAPTTSLPIQIGGVRNWDYRFSWPRDASIGIETFLSCGSRDEARAFTQWLVHASRTTRPRLQVLYTIYGQPSKGEQEIAGVEGYRETRPVRIGNAAAEQHQLDVYGWVLLAARQMVRAGEMIAGPTWRAMASIADGATMLWKRPDHGIWEIRGAPSHYVHSKLMAWVGLESALEIARTRGVDGRRVGTWARASEELRSSIMQNGVDSSGLRLIRAFGNEEMDAANLILPSTGFLSPDHPAVRGTVQGVVDELGAGGPLLFRFRPGKDGLQGKDSAFFPCSFWLVKALCGLGDWDRAGRVMDELCALGGQLGLYPEQVDPVSGEFLGNYPLALTHATLLQAACALAAAP